MSTGTRATDDAELARLRVLAVDDHEINRRFIESALRSRVASLVLARNGHEAVSLCNRRQFDVVLMDIHMPDMDGVTTWHRIVRHDGAPGTRVLALTADHRAEERERLQQAGFHGFLSKPVSLQILLRALVRAASTTDGFIVFEQALPRRTALIDAARAEQAAGSAARAVELGRAFVPELAAAPDQLDSLLADRRHDEASAFLHRLHGAAGYVGAVRLQHACRLLQDSLDRQLDSSPGTLFVSWVRTVAGTRSTLERAVAD